MLFLLACRKVLCSRVLVVSVKLFGIVHCLTIILHTVVLFLSGPTANQVAMYCSIELVFNVNSS